MTISATRPVLSFAEFILKNYRYWEWDSFCLVDINCNHRSIYGVFYY